MATSVFAGFNIIYYSIIEALGEKVEIKNLSLKEEVSFQRYWGGIASINGEFAGKI